jgi:tRNA(adenine34) deaminase
MCAGAVINSRIERVVYGAPDRRAGAFGTLIDLNSLPLNHKTEVVGGVLGEECARTLSEYFKKKRK